MHDEITAKLIAEKTAQIDNCFFKFLAENGITDSREATKIVEALKKADLEVFNEVQQTEDGEIYKFRLCRVVAEDSINIPTPKINIEHEPKNGNSRD